MEQVILVDETDALVGRMEKFEAHKKAKLHRAFSIYTFNKKGEMLLQRRAIHKYHSGGLWTNTCCSHPRPGEKTIDAAHRRLKEEMGFDCDVSWIFKCKYKAGLDNDMTEHELLHVYVGRYDGVVEPDPEEVDAYEYKALDKIQQEIAEYPERYTEWFKIIIKEYGSQLGLLDSSQEQ